MLKLLRLVYYSPVCDYLASAVGVIYFLQQLCVYFPILRVCF